MGKENMSTEIYYFRWVESIYSRENAFFPVPSALRDTLEKMNQVIFWESLFKFGISKSSPVYGVWYCLQLASLTEVSRRCQNYQQFPTVRLVWKILGMQKLKNCQNLKVDTYRLWFIKLILLVITNSAERPVTLIVSKLSAIRDLMRIH